MENKLKQNEQMFNNLNTNVHNISVTSPITRTNELIGFYVSNGSANGSPLFKGPRGGVFYYNSNDNKSYVTGLNNHIRYIL